MAMKKIIEFISNALKQGKDESSKRLFGAIGFICAIFFIAIWGHEYINELLYVSAGLLGLGILDKLVKK